VHFITDEPPPRYYLNHKQIQQHSPEVVDAVHLIRLAIHNVAKRVARAVDLLARELRSGRRAGKGRQEIGSRQRAQAV